MVPWGGRQVGISSTSVLRKGVLFAPFLVYTGMKFCNNIGHCRTRYIRLLSRLWADGGEFPLGVFLSFRLFLFDVDWLSRRWYSSGGGGGGNGGGGGDERKRDDQECEPFYLRFYPSRT